MKSGRPLKEVAAEIQRINQSKKDVIADTRQIRFETDKDGSILTVDGVENLPALAVSPLAHSQIADRLGVPKKYYDRLAKDHPAILDANVNGLFEAAPERRMIRALDGRVRAFLSDRYRRLDNYDLMNVILPELQKLGSDYGGLEVKSVELTDTRLYLKAVFPQIQATMDAIVRGKHEFIPEGERRIVQAGIVVQNSEVGKGAIMIAPLLFELACFNGYIVEQFGTRKHHVGRGAENDEAAAYEIFADDTLKADDEAYWKKVRDVTRATIDEATFTQLVGKFEALQTKAIQPAKAVEVLVNDHGFTKDEGDDVLKHLVEYGDLNTFGLVRAITRMAQDVTEYDRSTELEAFGGKVISGAVVLK